MAPREWQTASSLITSETDNALGGNLAAVRFNSFTALFVFLCAVIRIVRYLPPSSLIQFKLYNLLIHYTYCVGVRFQSWRNLNLYNSSLLHISSPPFSTFLFLHFHSAFHFTFNILLSIIILIIIYHSILSPRDILLRLVLHFALQTELILLNHLSQLDSIFNKIGTCPSNVFSSTVSFLNPKQYYVLRQPFTLLPISRQV